MIDCLLDWIDFAWQEFVPMLAEVIFGPTVDYMPLPIKIDWSKPCGTGGGIGASSAACGPSSCS